MRIFVDELPKSCKDCKFQCFGECLNGADILNCDYNSMKCHLKRGKVKDCPLQSLADYTKQVRKEVCEQIKAEFDTSGLNKIGASLYPPTEEAMWIGKGFNACKERLFNKLDQIQEDR